jgi:hypothetical protein
LGDAAGVAVSAESPGLGAGRPVLEGDPPWPASAYAAPDGDLHEAVEELRRDLGVVRVRGQGDRAPERPVEPLANVKAVASAGVLLRAAPPGDGQDPLGERDVDVLGPLPSTSIRITRSPLRAKMSVAGTQAVASVRTRSS